MADRPWWLQSLQWVLWFIAMSLVMGWLAKARKPAAREQGRLVLSHPSSTLILGVVCVGMFGAFAVLSALSVDEDEWWVPVLFLGFVLMGVALLLEALRVRHVLTDSGVIYQGLLRRYELVRWQDLAMAQWKPAMKWLVLTARDGRVMRFSALLNGLDSLAIQLAERVPAIEMDNETSQMLAAAREGRLPSVWM